MEMGIMKETNLILILTQTALHKAAVDGQKPEQDYITMWDIQCQLLVPL